MVFIYKSHLDEITVLTNDEGLSEVLDFKKLVKAEEDMSRETEVSTIRNHVFEALGYDPQFGFEAKNIVVVEGKTDKKILQAFARTLNIELDTSLIIPFGNKRNVERYVPVFAYTLTSKKCLILLDNDLKSPEETKVKILSMESEYKKKIGAKKILNESNFYLFPEKVYSIEYYLLESQAIYRAASVSDPTKIDEIDKLIKEKLTLLEEKSITPKDLLKEIWETLKVGPYEEVETAEKIAKNISIGYLEKNPEIDSLFKAIMHG